jgi:hypothetical protein
MKEVNALRVPTESDWGNYKSDLDQSWAHDHYLGRSNAEMQAHFRNNPIEASSDLQFMPEIPFRYYVLGFRDSIITGALNQSDAPDAASCFLNLFLNRLEEQPR